MIIECPYCESKVDGIIKGEHETYGEHEDCPSKRVLLACPICNSSLLGLTEHWQIGNEEYKWSDAVRLWPEPDRVLSWELPDIVSISLNEAQKCFSSKAYIACAVMCGRALEGICKDFGTKHNNIAGGLKELLDREIIDKRIFDWGEALRIHRNIGAHASDVKISKVDASDLLDFALAICDYIYILRNKFESFMERRKGS
ncbi:protein of unknown function [Paenibacillus sp. UNCCL117]|uniref:DUF4145 domain-containing protein n=1 Tax=unclassified Paenibacillus TaxID=185978 RepID=UPI000883F284|nr:MULTISPECIES: DUF4145 domain-containing protein [unclassified Paenibacillus]SDE70596.1 protein of unknown function [Paenibacillus sp. cl123]SFW71219.1 protein of unknown function [Paenibacillus sp. UNCCL117]